MSATDLDTAAIEQRLGALGTKVGLPVSFAEQTGSTNEDAMQAGLSGAQHGALFVADAQLAGRGRLGRTWYSPPGQNLYLSFLLKPRVDPASLASMTLVAGLAVAEAAMRFLPAGVVGIKWPNDILVGQRKLAGILVEASTTKGRVDQVVVGIGFNVRQTKFDDEIAPIATSLELESGAAPARLDVLAAIVERLDVRLGEFDRGALPSIVEAIRALDVLKGRALRVNEVEGSGDGIDDAGRLRIRKASGEVVAVNAGEVKLVR